MVINYRVDLYKLLPENPVTVELGVAEGLFSEHILTEWKPSLHYAVDAWESIGIEGYTGDGTLSQKWHNKNYVLVMRRFKPFRNKVKILRGLTWRMAQHVPYNSVDLVYIDAGHAYESVKKDINAWWPIVKRGGIMAFHDFENTWDYGVQVAVREFAQAEGIEVHKIKEEKIEDAGAWIRKP